MSDQTTHELKTWPAAFAAMLSGAKTGEFRKDDRPGGFQLGDSLRLREYDPGTDSYSGREMTVTVTDVQRGPDWGIPAGYAVMSTQREDGAAILADALAEVRRLREAGLAEARAIVTGLMSVAQIRRDGMIRDSESRRWRKDIWQEHGAFLGLVRAHDALAEWDRAALEGRPTADTQTQIDALHKALHDISDFADIYADVCKGCRATQDRVRGALEGELS